MSVCVWGGGGGGISAFGCVCLGMRVCGRVYECIHARAHMRACVYVYVCVRLRENDLVFMCDCEHTQVSVGLAARICSCILICESVLYCVT